MMRGDAKIKRKRSGKNVKHGQSEDFSTVMRYENPGQLTVPTYLLLGSGSKLYLAHGNGTVDLTAKPQPITVRESVAWLRLAHDCHVHVTKEAGFSEWLKLVERELAVTTMLRSMTR